MIRSPDDTQYFDEDEPITDLSDSEDDDEDLVVPPSEILTSPMNVDTATGRDGADDMGLDCTTPRGVNSIASSASTVNHVQLPMTPPNSQPRLWAESGKDDAQRVAPPEAVTPNAASANSSKKRAEREAHLAELLSPFDRNLQHAVRSWLAVPYDSLRIRNFELQVDVEPGLRKSQRDALKALVRLHGRKEKKRPRDRLLRDPLTKKAVMEERKKTAFLGYEWRRGQTLPLTAMMMVPGLVRSVGIGHPGPVLPPSATMGNGFMARPDEFCQAGTGGWAYLRPGHEHLAALRALHRGGLSMN